ISDEQPSLDAIRPEEWLFTRPVVIDVPRGEAETVEPRDLAPHAAALRDADFIAVRTGFASRRHDEAFGTRGPSFSPAAAAELMRLAPRLRALGTDAVSTASPARPDDAVAVHRVFLGTRRGDRYVFLVEDMDLSAWRVPLDAILVVPLAVKDADGVPCSV